MEGLSGVNYRAANDEASATREARDFESCASASRFSKQTARRSAGVEGRYVEPPGGDCGADRASSCKTGVESREIT